MGAELLAANLRGCNLHCQGKSPLSFPSSSNCPVAVFREFANPFGMSGFAHVHFVVVRGAVDELVVGVDAGAGG